VRQDLRFHIANAIAVCFPKGRAHPTHGELRWVSRNQLTGSPYNQVRIPDSTSHPADFSCRYFDNTGMKQSSVGGTYLLKSSTDFSYRLITSQSSSRAVTICVV
jgi:hypothetical protein